MRFQRRETGGKRLIELVPVVNVILLLVCFFLLSWSFVQQPGIEVRPPQTSLESVAQQPRHVITLKSLDAGEALIFFDEKSVSPEELRGSLQMAAKKSPGAWITLNADEKVSHGKVLNISAQVMEQGFHLIQATRIQTPAVSP